MLIDRVFLAVDLDVEARAAMAAQLETIEVPGRPTELANWHVTLRYLGSIEAHRLDQLLARLDAPDHPATLDGDPAEPWLPPPFTVTFGDLDAFPYPEAAAVLYRTVADPSGHLHRLAATIETVCQDLGLEPEDRDYIPHLTLSRLRPAADIQHLVDTVEWASVRLKVDTITVFTSDDPDSRLYRVHDTLALPRR